MDEASGTHEPMELDGPSALPAFQESESDDCCLVDNERVGDFDPSSADWESSCSREKVLLSLWMCRRFFGRGFGFAAVLGLGGPVAELAFGRG